MEDPALNRALEETRELQTRWSQFRDFVGMAMKGEQITPQAEMKFIELKSRIAMLHDGFISQLKHEQKTGQNMMNILNEVILLKKASEATDAERQKFEFDWNECYLLVTESVTSMDEEKKRLAAINERSYKSQKRRELMQVRIKSFFQSKGLYYLGALVGIPLAIWLIPTLGLYDYKDLYNIEPVRPAYLGFVNHAWRPFIDGDFEHEKFEDVVVDDEYVPDEISSIKRENARDLTADYFITQEMPAVGMSAVEHQELKKHFDKRQHFESERYTAQGKDMRFYWVMFDTSADAREFNMMLRNAYEKLPDARQKAIENDYFVTRQANLVIMGIGGHVMRDAHPKQYFKLKEPKQLFGFSNWGA